MASAAPTRKCAIQHRYRWPDDNSSRRRGGTRGRFTQGASHGGGPLPGSLGMGRQLAWVSSGGPELVSVVE
jgi:hypothetical protein